MAADRTDRRVLVFEMHPAHFADAPRYRARGTPSMDTAGADGPSPDEARARLAQQRRRRLLMTILASCTQRKRSPKGNSFFKRASRLSIFVLLKRDGDSKKRHPALVWLLF
ncbi:MAG: hypothetical protein F9K38_02345 [Pseudorhodoplanes sp.]|nr:MAG: hypothetical protein F9K38_02345 [Pseudorhodoplanes sp.]